MDGGLVLAGVCSLLVAAVSVLRDTTVCCVLCRARPALATPTRSPDTRIVHGCFNRYFQLDQLISANVGFHSSIS